jgi:hypothetical protein
VSSVSAQNSETESRSHAAVLTVIVDNRQQEEGRAVMKIRVAGGLMLLVAFGLAFQTLGRAQVLAAAAVIAVAGVAVLIGGTWGRWLGLAVSVVGLVFMGTMASLANTGQGGNLAQLFFADSRGYFSWWNVLIYAGLYALAFGASVALLALSFTSPADGEPPGTGH